MSTSTSINPRINQPPQSLGSQEAIIGIIKACNSFYGELKNARDNMVSLDELETLATKRRLIAISGMETRLKVLEPNTSRLISNDPRIEKRAQELADNRLSLKAENLEQLNIDRLKFTLGTKVKEFKSIGPNTLDLPTDKLLANHFLTEAEVNIYNKNHQELTPRKLESLAKRLKTLNHEVILAGSITKKSEIGVNRIKVLKKMRDECLTPMIKYSKRVLSHNGNVGKKLQSTIKNLRDGINALVTSDQASSPRDTSPVELEPIHLSPDSTTATERRLEISANPLSNIQRIWSNLIDNELDISSKLKRITTIANTVLESFQQPQKPFRKNLVIAAEDRLNKSIEELGLLMQTETDHAIQEDLNSTWDLLVNKIQPLLSRLETKEDRSTRSSQPRIKPGGAQNVDPIEIAFGQLGVSLQLSPNSLNPNRIWELEEKLNHLIHLAKESSTKSTRICDHLNKWHTKFNATTTTSLFDSQRRKLVEATLLEIDSMNTHRIKELKSPVTPNTLQAVTISPKINELLITLREKHFKASNNPNVGAIRQEYIAITRRLDELRKLANESEINSRAIYIRLSSLSETFASTLKKALLAKQVIDKDSKLSDFDVQRQTMLDAICKELKPAEFIELKTPKPKRDKFPLIKSLKLEGIFENLKNYFQFGGKNIGLDKQFTKLIKIAKETAHKHRGLYKEIFDKLLEQYLRFNKTLSKLTSDRISLFAQRKRAMLAATIGELYPLAMQNRPYPSYKKELDLKTIADTFNSPADLFQDRFNIDSLLEQITDSLKSRKIDSGTVARLRELLPSVIAKLDQSRKKWPLVLDKLIPKTSGLASRAATQKLNPWEAKSLTYLEHALLKTVEIAKKDKSMAAAA